MTTIKLLNPEDFKVINVYSFIDKGINKMGYVGYYRPLTPTYNKNINDTFDTMFERWLGELNLQDVHRVAREDIFFEGQMENFTHIFANTRPSASLFITAHADYTYDEMIKMGEIEAYNCILPIFWNAKSDDMLLDEGGMVTYDKNNEAYLRDIVKIITPLRKA